MKFNTIECEDCLIINKQGLYSNIKIIISKYPSLDSDNDPSDKVIYFDIYYPSDNKYSSCNLLGYINKNNLQVGLITPKEFFEGLLDNRYDIGVGLDILKKYFEQLFKVNESALSHITYKTKDNRAYYVDIAKNEYKNNAFKSSINNALHALALNPNDSELYFLVGEDYYALDEKIPAIRLYRRAILYNSHKAQYYISLADTFNELGIYDESLRNSTKAIEIDSSNPRGYIVLVNTYACINETQNAIKVLRKAIRVIKNKDIDARFLSDIGILEQSHDAKRALSNYQKAVSLDPYNSGYVEFAGNAYKELGNYQKAINEYKQATYINPKPDYYYDLARIEQIISDYDNSLHYIHIAIQLSPKNSDYYSFLGNLLSNNLQLQYPAIKYYRRAIHLDKNNATYYSGLGSVYNNLDDYERSIKYCEKSLSINPKDADVWNTLSASRSSEKQYNPQLAISEEMQAIKLDNTVSVYYDNLARIEQAINHFSLSIKNIKRAIKINPNNSQYRKHLKKVEQLRKANGVPSDVDCTKKLNQLIGLKPVKSRLKTYIHRVQIEKLRTGKHNHGEMHIVFEGNPGTGKTTVAKLLSSILYQKGITDKPKCVEMHATQIVSKDYGASSRNVRSAFKKAMGGVLFIDEAYTLAHHTKNSYAEDEAVNELVPDLEKYNDSVVVILAGYPHKMEYFLNKSNPGLSSRFRDIIPFPDFSNQACERIMDLYLHQHQYRLASNEAKQLLHKDLNEYITARRADNQHIFANARTVRTIYEKLRDVVADRLCNTYSKKELKSMSKNKQPMLNKITKSDVKRTFKPFDLLRYNQNAKEALNNLIGLKHIKSLVNTYVNRVIMNKLRTGHKNHGEMNFIFEGNPGTGKTTVAKLFGKILFQAGITKSCNLVYVSAAELTGKYYGDGVKKVKRAVHNALNGVLFIDEAYMLSNVEYIASVSELVKDIEQYRNKLVVILAGYKHGMEHLLKNSNAGLNSRFSEKVIFPNYTNKECQQIMLYDLKKDNFTLASSYTKKLLMKKLNKYITFKRHSDPHSFANARTVRNVYKRIVNNFSNRILDNHALSKGLDDLKGTNLINTINSADINKSFNQINSKLKDQQNTRIGF